MKDYNKMFPEGQEVSAFIKNSNKIWEGKIIIRSDGTKVVLNENKSWKKLSDLESVKRTGVLLYEEESLLPDIDNFSDLVNNALKDKKIDPSKVDSKTLKDFTNSAMDMAEKAGLETPKEDQAEQQATDQIAAANAINQSDNIGDQAKAAEAREEFEDVKDKILEEKIKNSLLELHPILQPYLRENKLTERLFMEDELRELGRKVQDPRIVTFDELRSLGDNAEINDIEYEMENYEDENYLDIDPTLKDEIINRALGFIHDDVDNIAETLKSNYELSDEDAEEFAVCAMEKFLDETDIEPRECIEPDEVEDDFEKTIDNYNGPNDELLDYLVVEYEIDPQEAEYIYEEKKGNLTECIMAFVDIVKNRLNEHWNPPITASSYPTFGCEKPYISSLEKNICKVCGLKDGEKPGNEVRDGYCDVCWAKRCDEKKNLKENLPYWDKCLAQQIRKGDISLDEAKQLCIELGYDEDDFEKILKMSKGIKESSEDWIKDGGTWCWTCGKRITYEEIKNDDYLESGEPQCQDCLDDGKINDYIRMKKIKESEKPINQFKHHETFEDNEYYWDEDDEIDWDATRNREIRDREKYDSFYDMMPDEPIKSKDTLYTYADLCNPYNKKSRRQWHRHIPIFKREIKQPKIGRVT